MINITHEEFYNKLENSKVNPTTSQISPADYEDVYEDVKKCGDTAVVITLSSKLSGTYQSANIARDGYEDCIYIVDSASVTLGEQLLVLYACRLRDMGLSAVEIVAALEDKKKDIVVITHFPPFYPEFKQALKDIGAKVCIYGHLHGNGHYMVKQGKIDDIEYIMASGDYTGFKLIKIKE